MERTPAGRALATRVLSFGIVSIPVKLYSATEERKQSFNRICREHGCAVKQPWTCEAGGERLDATGVVKGLDIAGVTVTVEDGELADCAPDSASTIKLQQFVPVAQIGSTLRVKATYYIGPNKGGEAALATLRAALRKTGKAAIAKVQLRAGSPESLCAITANADGDVILSTVFWPDEVRNGEALRVDNDVDKQTLDMAVMLVETLSGDFDPNAYQDEYRAKVDALVASKYTPAPAKVNGEMIDLVGALKKSLGQAA